jgi:multiple sugar transport system ATP-binding protein
MAEISLKDVTKRYPDGTEAVQHMNLDIADGEFMIFVGPSGCGKSTALRMIAGLEDITEGEVRIGDEVVNQRAPKDRDIAMVFQNYALYPHMTVRDNMGFALKLAKVPKDEINKKVEEAARILDLTDHLDRKPANLSGGQRQRVAMGRAIVRDPKAFLMDEPLSNLDAKLRVQMRIQVSRIQNDLGTTTVYVTHDQTEAMTLGDRVAVMRGGRLQQVDSPRELYANPGNLFVAGFIGSPSMNFMSATVEGDKLKLPLGEIPLSERQRAAVGKSGGSLIVGLRPEHFADAAMMGDERERGVTFETKIDVLESMGSEYYAYFHIEGRNTGSAELQELAADLGASDMAEEDTTQAVARLDIESQVREGERIELWFDPEQMHLFDADGGERLIAADGGRPAGDSPGSATVRRPAPGPAGPETGAQP